MNPLLSTTCQNVCVVTFLVVFSCGTFAQRAGGFQGGFSGARGGFSAPHAGFSGMRPGFSAPAGGFHSSPAFRSGFFAPRPGFRPIAPRSMPPAGFAPRRSPYPVRGLRPVGGSSMSMASSSMHRAPFHSPNGGHHGHDGHFHNRVIIVSRFPFRGFPFVWGYPNIWPSIFDDWDNWDNYDSQQPGNYAPPQPSCNGSGTNQYKPQPDQYNAQPDDQDDPPANEQRAQPSSSSRRAPHRGAQESPPPSGPVMLVYKHGGTLEYIYNYVMTPKTLTVLDEPRRVIPLDQIDLEASAIASEHAGVEFSRRVPSP